MNNINKNIIITYAKALRTIQKEQIDPYIELIEKELIKLFPELEHREDNALNWAYDILNADSNAEVVETLNRVEKIITEERKETWNCNYCGKNTYNDDVEYLFGTNHIGCALEDDSSTSIRLRSRTNQLKTTSAPIGALFLLTTLTSWCILFIYEQMWLWKRYSS